jgi:hypothetical protein
VTGPQTPTAAGSLSRRGGLGAHDRRDLRPEALRPAQYIGVGDSADGHLPDVTGTAEQLMLHDDCETGALTASGFHASERSSSGCVHNYWLGCEDGPVSDSPTMPLENAHPRPPVAVVMPFAGTAVEARESLGALATLITRHRAR